MNPEKHHKSSNYFFPFVFLTLQDFSLGPCSGSIRVSYHSCLSHLDVLISPNSFVYSICYLLDYLTEWFRLEMVYMYIDIY